MTPFRRLFGYVRPYRGAFAAGLVCVISTRAVTLTAPIVLSRAIDDLARSVTRAKLVEYGGLLLAIGIVGGVFRFYMRQILTGASRDIEYDMRNAFFAHLQKLPLGYFQAHRTGDLMSRATNDLNAVRMMVGPAVMYSADTVFGFIAAISLMLSIDVRLTLLSLIPLPFVSIAVKYFGSAIHKRFEQIQAQLSEVSAVAQEALSGVRVIRAYRQEAAEVDRFRRASAEYVRRNRRLVVLQGMFFPSMSFLLGLGALLVLWLGSREVIRGRITLGQFVAFNAYLTMLAWPMIAFGWVTNMLQRGMASWKRMGEVLDTEPAIRDAPSVAGAPPVTVRGAIEFRDLVFSFGGPPVLSHVSLRIEAGQTAAIVGATGSGKSTLIALLARLHEPPAGTVFIDGVDVLDLPLSTLRGAIGFVPQEPFLFSDTLGDNIAFGLDALPERESLRSSARDSEAAVSSGHGAPREVEEARRLRPSRTEDLNIRGEGSASVRGGGGAPPPVEDASPSQRLEVIQRAAAVARLDKDIADFPKGYDTAVGERGLTLSGGQKQRAAIARAVVMDPPILILDDALSAVDTYTEEEILARLRGVMRQRTSIIVSHRISTVRDADQIFVLDAGHVVERGTHESLIARGGVYAALHRKQLLEEELAAS